ncbi:MAG: ABC transporter substrate-binding protein [Gemmatimonadaceae bacterium]|nr:ABC transporter substrate-binding protein [Gemmatimonadaceae bacterium]
MRVVSLLPAATEIVAALGALPTLVGISHECDFPPEVAQLPRLTASLVNRDDTSAGIDAAVRALAATGAPVFALDADQLRRLAPTLVITQALCEVCALSAGAVCALTDVVTPSPRVLQLSGTTLDGVQEDIIAVGAALERDAAAAELLAAISARLRAVHETLKAARAPRPRVAVIEWLDPLFFAGHWTPDLVRRAGGIDVLASPGAHSTTITADQVRDAQPELLLFAPCGFDAERAEREARALLGTDAWRWARGLRCWALDGNALTSRPGPRLADAVEVMAAIVAPALFRPPDATYARPLAEPDLH